MEQMSVTGNTISFFRISSFASTFLRIRRFVSTKKWVGYAKGNIYELISHRDNGFRALHFLWDTGQVRPQP
jgi:hypothetical protein